MFSLRLHSLLLKRSLTLIEAVFLISHAEESMGEFKRGLTLSNEHDPLNNKGSCQIYNMAPKTDFCWKRSKFRNEYVPGIL